MHICIYTSLHTYVCLTHFVLVCISTCMCVCACTRLRLHAYVCVCVCVCVWRQHIRGKHTRCLGTQFLWAHNIHMRTYIAHTYACRCFWTIFHIHTHSLTHICHWPSLFIVIHLFSSSFLFVFISIIHLFSSFLFLFISIFTHLFCSSFPFFISKAACVWVGRATKTAEAISRSNKAFGRISYEIQTSVNGKSARLCFFPDQLRRKQFHFIFSFSVSFSNISASSRDHVTRT
jgi:hypothetical protein